MKTARMLVLCFMLVLPATSGAAVSAISGNSDQEVRIAALRIILTTYAALAEEHLEGTLRSLTLLAGTEEAKSGEWEAIKGPLAEFARSGINAAAVWYARPDGSYFSVEKGLTGQNLRDRPYFPRLMAGEEVVGELVISKSTGKRVLVVAAPIRKGGTVVGALGVSLSAQAVSRMLQERMALPADMVFYALDAHGQSALHKETSRLFQFPSDMGSRTLKDAVREMLSRQEGVVRYEFHGRKLVVYKRSPLTGWVFAIGVVEGVPTDAAGSDVAPILSELEKEIGLSLTRIDAALSRAANRLAAPDVTGQEGRKILRDLCGSVPSSVDCAIVDDRGTMTTIEPEEYRRFEGSDISGQEQVARLRATKKPVMSGVFRTVEGFDAVDVEYPVFSPRGTFAGSVSILIRPEFLVAEDASRLVRGLPIDVWAMQEDGRILYDPDREEIGKILFTDPIYEPFPQLRALGAEIAKKRAGSGMYEFLGKGLKKQVRKDASWTTVGLYGTEWRVVTTHTLVDDGTSGKRGLAELGVKSSEESLRDLAGREELQEALAGNDRGTIQRLFRDFHANRYGIYAIQWVDTSGVNRYGYPEENSPMGYDFRAMKTPSSQPILQALAAKRESSFEVPLAEGKTGDFFMVPVHKGNSYLGMIYIIRVVP